MAEPPGSGALGTLIRSTQLSALRGQAGQTRRRPRPSIRNMSSVRAPSTVSRDIEVISSCCAISQELSSIAMTTGPAAKESACGGVAAILAMRSPSAAAVRRCERATAARNLGSSVSPRRSG